MRRWTHTLVLMGLLGPASLRGWCQMAHAELAPLQTGPAQAQTRQATAEERRKRIAEDAAKLLVLANELKALVDKTTKDQMSLEVIRKAEQIEKAARELKQRMREAA